MAASVIGKQTIPRSELWAGILAAEAGLSNSAQKVTISDCAYFVNGAKSENIDNLEQGSNGDLWGHWQNEVKRASHCVEKVKAHAEREVLQEYVAVDDFLANALADATADAYAISQVNPLAAWQALEEAEA